MKSKKEGLRAKFQRALDEWVLFHLGADAQVSFEEGTDRLCCRLTHSRVEPFEFSVSFQEIAVFLEDQPVLERFLIEQLTLYRR